MGLDNYFYFKCSPGETAPLPDIEDGITLFQGMLSSGDNCSAFRGKVYAPAVEQLTEFDLYADSIKPNECVALGIHLLDATHKNNEDDVICEQWELNVSHIRDLARVFITYGEAGFCCESWY